MSAEFSDYLSDGTRRHLILKHDPSCGLNIYSSDPKQGGVLVARMVNERERWHCRELSGYYIDISGNVDIAIVLMLCIAVEIVVHKPHGAR